MKITDISLQVKNHNRLNISVDGKYRFSLDLYQVADLGIKVGHEYSETELSHIENESQFGKLYARALEYCLMRPHSVREVKDYLWRKTRATKYKTREGQIKDREGVSQLNADRTFERLVERGYVDDEKFARFWVENRNQTKGSSLRKITAELRSKGVDASIIESALGESDRSDDDELKKVIHKKRSKYVDDQKLIAYLARQGFSYDDIKMALTTDD
ncbi:RecX family transcriptional regulator [Candidatus Saccharibacteria bacterium]|nr:RecX family transcriptional regulator [Candidatus Saccharibacteria bacterium]